MSPANHRNYPGTFIVFEGPDGGGKSTLTAYFVEKLRELIGGQNLVVQTREVGGTPVAERCRALAFHDQGEFVAPITRLMLVFAARLQHLHHVVDPALQRGEIVVSDRFNDSTAVLQGGVDKLNFAIRDMERIDELEHCARRPDVLFYIRIPAEEQIKRQKARPADNVEYKGVLEKSIAVTEHYEERMRRMKQLHPDKTIYEIDGMQPLEQIYGFLDGVAMHLVASRNMAKKAI